jgi:hypothetical protein
MYEVLDSFLAGNTWSTRHAADEERFFRALNEIVDDPGFNPERLREYIANECELAEQSDESHDNVALDKYVADAWAVKTFLSVTGR